MTPIHHDRNFAVHQVEDAALDLMYVLDVPNPTENDGTAFLAERLLVREIDFLYDLVEGMSPSGRRSFRQYLRYVTEWRTKWGGEMRGNAPAAHALTLAAVIIPLMEKYYDNASAVISTRDLTDLINEAMANYRSCAQRYMPNDGISARDLPLIRGEIMTHVIMRRMGIDPEADYTNEFFAWLGSHEDDVVAKYDEIIVRRTFDPELIRELLGGGTGSKALAEGVL